MKTFIVKVLASLCGLLMVGLIFLLISHSQNKKTQVKNSIIDGQIIVCILYKYNDWPTLKFCDSFASFTLALEKYDNVEQNDKNLDSLSTMVLSDKVFNVSKEMYIMLLQDNSSYYISKYIYNCIENKKDSDITLLYDSCLSQMICLADERMDSLIYANHVEIPYILYNCIDSFIKYKDIKYIGHSSALCGQNSQYTELYYKNYEYSFINVKNKDLIDSLYFSQICQNDTLEYILPVIYSMSSSIMFDQEMCFSFFKRCFDEGIYFYQYDYSVAKELYADKESHYYIQFCSGG